MTEFLCLAQAQAGYQRKHADILRTNSPASQENPGGTSRGPDRTAASSKLDRPASSQSN